jgi:hypothetical protein
MSTTRASAALLSRIAQAALKEFGRDDLDVAQAPAGMALGALHIDLLQELELDRLEDPASVARLIEISRIVDCIQVHPGVMTTPNQDPEYLSDVFPRLIKNVEFVTAPLSDDNRRQYEQAQAILFEAPPFLKTQAYQEFCLLRADLEKKDVVLAEMRQTLQHLDTPEERSTLESELAALEQVCTEQREVLEALDRTHSFRAAEAIVDKAERRIDEIPESIRVALDTMELFQLTDPSTNDTHVGCSFFPSHLAEDNWAPLKLTRADIERGEQDSNDTSSDPDELDDSEIDSIELEVQTLVCERPWLWSPLFENRHWDWRTPSEPISTGSGDGGAGELIPAYIHALIFGRNLTVRGQPASRSRVLRVAEKTLQPTATLLMRAIKPVSQLSQTVSAPRAMAVNGSVSTPQAMTRVAPLVRRSTVTPTVVRARPVGPAVVRTPRGSSSAPSTATASAALSALVQRVSPLRLVLRPGIIRKLTVKGRVVDEQGHGIYQATVTLEGQVGRRRVITGRDGSFSCPTIDQGRYRLQVEKAGFATVQGAVTVPQNAPQTIRMRQVASCQVLVRLIEQVDGAQRPFDGAAKVVIQDARSRRLESMDGRSQASFSLPPGDFTFVVTSTEAEQISPARASVTLRVGGQASQTLTFTIQPAPMLRNPEVQLLGFVCRRVPLSPAPASVNGGS